MYFSVMICVWPHKDVSQRNRPIGHHRAEWDEMKYNEILETTGTLSMSWCIRQKLKSECLKLYHIENQWLEGLWWTLAYLCVEPLWGLPQRLDLPLIMIYCFLTVGRCVCPPVYSSMTFGFWFWSDRFCVWLWFCSGWNWWRSFKCFSACWNKTCVCVQSL